jgi:hypothetical protein
MSVILHRGVEKQESCPPEYGNTANTETQQIRKHSKYGNKANTENVIFKGTIKIRSKKIPKPNLQTLVEECLL